MFFFGATRYQNVIQVDNDSLHALQDTFHDPLEYDRGRRNPKGQASVSKQAMVRIYDNVLLGVVIEGKLLIGIA